MNRLLPKPITLNDYEIALMRAALAERSEPEVRVESLGPCLIWKGAKFTNGYGKIWHSKSRRLLKAHRVQLVICTSDSTLEACHKCDQPDCVEPSHLFWGTHADNMRDSTVKGRNGMLRYPERAQRGDEHYTRRLRHLVCGENNGQARLTQSQADEIRRKYAAGGILQKQLAVEYGVGRTAIAKIIRGESYAA